MDTYWLISFYEDGQSRFVRCTKADMDKFLWDLQDGRDMTEEKVLEEFASINLKEFNSEYTGHETIKYIIIKGEVVSPKILSKVTRLGV